MTIKEITKKGDLFHLSIVFENEAGQADLVLLCMEQEIELRGSFSFPSSGRNGVWVFTKLKNQKMAPSGETLFKNNCAVCHFTDSKAIKVGPGFLGLFKGDQLPSGKPISEAWVINQIRKGGGKMPPFAHLKDDELQALVEYLKSL
jgi:mono/diheme cytochrome c family protein